MAAENFCTFQILIYASPSLNITTSFIYDIYLSIYLAHIPCSEGFKNSTNVTPAVDKRQQKDQFGFVGKAKKVLVYRDGIDVFIVQLEHCDAKLT